MNYRYVARDPMGRRVEGEIESSSREQVVLELRGRALEPISIHPRHSRQDVVAATAADVQTPEADLQANERSLLEILAPAEATGADPAEKGGISRWFGIVLLILYVLYEFFN